MRIMVELLFGDLTSIDIILAVLTGIIGGIVLSVSYKMAASGVSNWIPRKLVHVSMGTLIALTVLSYATISGPFLAAGIFLTILFYAWAHKSDLISELLTAGSREEESRANTFFSGLMGMVAFSVAFLVFLPRPEIFVAAILAVSWGDAAGEVVGRTMGGTFVKKRYMKKSFEGSIGVFVFSMLSILVALAVFSVDTCPLCVLPQIAIIAGGITLVELFSRGWMDNFFIPLLTALLMWQLLFPGMTLFV